MKKPNFFMIGAPKSGTTSMANWLAEHPDIYMSPEKEPHYFRTDLDPTAIRDPVWYEGLFKAASDRHIAVGEASTGYLYSRTAVPNILRYSPEAKFLVVLRNPIEMAPSLHQQRVMEHNEPIRDFARAWAAQPERAQGRGAAKWCPDARLLLYGEICRLGEQLERLYEYVPRERVHVLFLEDVRADPRMSYLSVLDFLAVPDDGRGEFPVMNRASEPAFDRLRGFLKYIAVLRRRFRLPLIGTGVFALLHRVNRRPVEVQPLSEEVREVLVAYYRDDVAKLASLTGRNLDHWLH